MTENQQQYKNCLILQHARETKIKNVVKLWAMVWPESFSIPKEWKSLKPRIENKCLD